MAELVVTELEQALLWHRGVAMLRGQRWALRALRKAVALRRETELLERDVFADARKLAVRQVDDLASAPRILAALAAVAFDAAVAYWKELRAMPAWRREQMLS